MNRLTNQWGRANGVNTINRSTKNHPTQILKIINIHRIEKRNKNIDTNKMKWRIIKVEDLLVVEKSGWSKVSERRREGSRVEEEVSASRRRRWWRE